MNSEQQDQLEAYIDRYGLVNVLEAIADICCEKGNQISQRRCQRQHGGTCLSGSVAVTTARDYQGEITMTITFHIVTDNEAFSEPNKEAEIERIIKAWLAYGIEKGSHPLTDYNGNRVGSVTVKGN